MLESPPTLSLLLTTALSIAFVHTLVGVDHSLPFVVIGKARKWPLSKVLGLAAICGIGHVLSSVVLGYVGIGFGIALEKLEWIEASRGQLAANLLIGFGLAYGCFSLWKALRSQEHTHHHVHDNGIAHSHTHSHHSNHLHPHPAKHGGALTSWSLFVVFLFGPCEPLIPLLMAPTGENRWLWVASIAAVFGLATLGTMLGVVALGYWGFQRVRLSFLERFANVFAGFAIAGSGLAVQLLGI